MSEKEKEMREMVETLRKLPDHAQEKIGYMIEGAALVSGAHEDERSGTGSLCTGRMTTTEFAP